MTTEATDFLALTRALISELGSTDIIETEWEYGDFRLKITRQTDGVAAFQPTTIAAPRKATLPQQPETRADRPVATLAAKTDRLEVRAPIHGIFYTASEQSAPPLVAVDDRVTIGQALCVVEAMKVFTSVTAECDGTIVAIGPANGQEIAPGDLLFEIEKSIERQGNAP